MRNKHKPNPWENIHVALNYLFIGLGILAFLIISHEAYHFFSISGTPIGVCIGVCSFGDSYEDSEINASAGAAYLAWDNLSEEEYISITENRERDEGRAWLFSTILTLILVALLVISGDRRYG